MNTSLIPEIGSVPQGLRALRIAWVEAFTRGAEGQPFLPPEFVAKYCAVIHLVDIRVEALQTGPAGRIPGSFVVKSSDAHGLRNALRDDDPVVVVGDGHHDAASFAIELEKLGMKFAGCLYGGIHSWRSGGRGVTRVIHESDRKPKSHNFNWASEKKVLSREEIVDHLGDPQSIRRQKLASLLVNGGFNCVDGREPTAVLGTPGGDGGEAILVLSALEKVSGRPLSTDCIQRFLEARLDAFGTCSMHTDIGSGNKVIQAIRANPVTAKHVENISETLQWRRFFSRPPSVAHDEFLSILTDPGHIGCGHVRMAMTQAKEYGTRRELVEEFMRAFFLARWGGAEDAMYAPLPGGHAEGAVLQIVLKDGVKPFGFVPLVSPLFNGTQTFVAHPQVAKSMRGLLLDLLEECEEITRTERKIMDATVAELGAQQLGQTLSALAKGLPVFNITFDADAEKMPDVEQVGVIS